MRRHVPVMKECYGAIYGEGLCLAVSFNNKGGLQPLILALLIGAGGGVARPAFADDPDAIFGGGETDAFALHGQATLVDQYHPRFHSPYVGPQSLNPGQRGDETVDVTAFLGARLWRGAEIWIDPEIDQGFGLSDTLGIDGFTSAEAYKLGKSSPYPKIQRLFVRQTIDLGGESQKVDADMNQFAGRQTANRIVVTIGKMSVADVFDTNKYAHDSKNDFLNWALVDTGTFDYAADAWGYTYGAAAEWYRGDWTLRGGLFDLSGVPNNKNLDKTFHQYQLDGELERRWKLFGQDGAARVTAFLSRGRMGRYEDAVALADATDAPANIALVRHYHSRVGVSFNLEQGVTGDLGVFVRAGHADGQYEGYEFTDMMNTYAAGLSLKGEAWGRKDDTIGFAGEIGQASRAEEAYFNAGGTGILAGDGVLPHPGAEKIIETYYSLPILKFTHLSLDYQFVDNPAFNRDRGPVSVFGFRLHTQL
jgi:high affinity Mn2+ porin